MPHFWSHTFKRTTNFMGLECFKSSWKYSRWSTNSQS